ncbi:MAG TPA: type IV secretory system conjugative DNA transfer family protein [Candidatus Saccharimonadales bacterium]|nr:type IV secretory system conjugative DNA transfer family protein [Candidatus Saccharimonadales bacterium]
MIDLVVGIVVGVGILLGVLYLAYWQYRKILREAKNYERGLKMVPLLIHLPPSSDDIEVGARDSREVVEEAISQAQIMYNIIASTATKGFKSRLYGQRHISFEIVANKGLIHYYLVAPLVLMDVVKQAVLAAYPTARLEEGEEYNIFNPAGKVSGTIGGELTLKKEFAYPIATYQETKRDAMQAILNALSSLTREDGAGVQILLRPANEKWTKSSLAKTIKIRKDKGLKGSSLLSFKDVAEALWKPPESKEAKPEDKQLSTLEQATVDAIEDKTRHPGYEVLVRVIASSNTAARSQAILKNIVAAFALFDSPSKNGFKFSVSKNIEEFVTSFIFRFFPQELKTNVLNSVELATVFHFPDQRNTPTSQLQRQASKQVDGPNQMVDKGMLLGYNLFRGVKKEIRLGDVDRRRHVYIIGQTGTGKSGLLENLALQDMLDGKGFAFLDPHGDSAERLLAMVPRERVEDVIYFAPGDMTNTPVGLNLFEFETDDQKDFLIQEAIAMLYRLYDPGHTGIIGPRYEHWFRNAALTIMADPAGASFIDIPQVFNDNDFAKSKLKYVKDQTVLDFWNKEMAQTSDYHKSEVLGWFVSKFGAFLSNEMMRDIIGQTKSGFNLRDIMDNKKVLLINISKMGELNSQLMGMIFVMKFQAAAMGRANIPEDQRVDFTLYADEFQNFATESFEIILSQARKYRLSLVLANQFMTQLTDKIREAIIGNVGTVISGRIGTTDAELMSKKFTPTFDAEDLTRLPNFEAVASVMINNVPSSPFSMSLIPPLGQPNEQLAQALKRLSSAKYGRPKQVVEQEIFGRLRAGEGERESRRQAAMDRMRSAGGANNSGHITNTAAASARPGSGTGSSFLDEWLAKRKQQFGPINKPQPAPTPKPALIATPPTVSQVLPAQPAGPTPAPKPALPLNETPVAAAIPTQPVALPSASQAQVSEIRPPKPTPGTDKNLSLLQNRGVGAHISFENAEPAARSNDLTAHDSTQLEHAIHTAKAKVEEAKALEGPVAPAAPTPTAHPTELKVQRDAASSSDSFEAGEEDLNNLDEIYIDVHGKIHHRHEEEAASAAKITTPHTEAK